MPTLGCLTKVGHWVSGERMADVCAHLVGAGWAHAQDVSPSLSWKMTALFPGRLSKPTLGISACVIFFITVTNTDKSNPGNEGLVLVFSSRVLSIMVRKA